jgi:hypothetical protein
MSDIAEAKTVYEIVEFQEQPEMTELSTAAGEAFSAYIDGGKAADNPYLKGTAEYEEWLLEFAQILERTIKSLMEQMG